MALIQVPAIGDAFEWRVVVFSTIGAFYCLLAARELWARAGLKSRFPMALLLGFHAVVLMIRIPAVLVEAGTLAPEFGGRWFAPMALEALVFIQALAMLTLSLTKERAERRLRSMALSDPLTGLANRRAFFDQGAALIAGCVRGKRPTSLIAFDLDRFSRSTTRMAIRSETPCLKHSLPLPRQGCGPAILSGASAARSLPPCSPGPTRRRHELPPSG